MADTYTGSLKIMATAELNPFLRDTVLYGPGGGVFISICSQQSMKTPIVPYDLSQSITELRASIRNDGDEIIEAMLYYADDEIGQDYRTTTVTINPGVSKDTFGPLLERSKVVGTSPIRLVLSARVPGGAWKSYYTGSTTYTVEAALVPIGDITKVTLDDKLLPEGGTLDWVLHDDAHVKVFFKNTGTTTGAFHIWLVDETGGTITGCDVTTDSIPAASAAPSEYFVDLCVFLPDVVKIKTLTAHITP